MPVTSDIIALLANQGNAQAAGALRQGDIAAQEAARKQALWSAIISGGINIGLGLPQQIAQMRDMKALAQERQMKVQQAQQDMAGRAALGQTIHDMTDPETGTVDAQKVANALSAKGFPTIANAWLKQNSENAEALDKLRKIDEDRSKAQLGLVGDLAYNAGDDPDKFAAGLGLLATHKVIDPKTALQFGQLTQSDDWKTLRDKVLPLSPKWQAEQAELNKPTKLAPEEILTTGRGQILAKGGPKRLTNEAELAADAATLGTPGETPTAAQSKAALATMRQITPYQQAQLAQEAQRNPLIAAETARARAETTKANLEAQQLQGVAGTMQGVANVPDVQPGQKNEAFLKGLPPSQAMQVKALAEGRMQFPSGFALRSPYWQGMLQAVAKYDPSFDAINYNARAKTRNDFTSGASAKNINALNTVIQHLDRLSDSADNLSNIGSAGPLTTTANWLKNVVSKASGSPAVTTFEADKKAVTDELTRAWRQSGGAEADIKSWAQVLDSSHSPQQLHGAIQEIGQLLEGKLGALQNQYQAGMGTSDISVVTPKARQVLDKLETRAGGAPTVRVDAPNGKTYLFHTQAEADAFKQKAGIK